MVVPLFYLNIVKMGSSKTRTEPKNFPGVDFEKNKRSEI